jgi:tetratricopeptide (TPR) repeat protein
VEHDSGFAWANASLGLAEDWIGSSELSRQFFDRALGQLDRVTEKERLWIIALSAGGEEGVEAYRTYLQQYPDDRDGWYNLGNNLRFVGRVEEAMEAYEMSLAVDSLNPWARVNLGVGLDGLGRPEEAVEHFRQVEALDPSQLLNWRGDVNRISGFVLAKVGDTLGARTRFEALLSRGDEARANGLRSLALLEMHRGRHTQALDLLDQAIVNLQRANQPLSEYRNRIYRAQALSSLGRSDDLRRELALAQELAETGGWDPGWVVHLARLQADAGDLEAARGWLNRWRQDGESEGPNQWALELVRGEILLADGQTAQAVAAIHLADQLTRVPGGLVKAALGRALLGAGRLEEASEALREAIRLRSLGLEGQESWVLSHYWLGRALADQGRPAEALPYLERFIELWGGGDPELQGVGEARALLESLASDGEPAG